MPDSVHDIKQVARVFVGAAVGGVVGYYGCFWAAQQGFYAIILPGALFGLGSSFGRTRHLAITVICGLAALALGFFTEWRLEPFLADSSFKYFITHLSDLRPLTLIIIALGGAIGFWMPFRRSRLSGR
jgi:hypothetical protein